MALDIDPISLRFLTARRADALIEALGERIAADPAVSNAPGIESADSFSASLPSTAVATTANGIPFPIAERSSNATSPDAPRLIGTTSVPRGENRTALNATPAQQPSPSVRLSVAAESIARFVAEFPAAGESFRIPPLLSGGAAPDQIARTLKAGVEASGLFYESHVAQWAQGERPIESLAAEPQWRNNRDMPAPQRASTSPAQPAISSTSSAMRIDNGIDAATAAAARLDLPAPLAPIVREQLDVLATHGLSWKAELAPGREVRIEIREEGGGQSARDAARPWRATLSVDLPMLGRVDTEIRLAPTGAAIAVNAPAAAAEALDQARSELQLALEAAGVRLAGLGIRHQTDVAS